MGATIVVGGFFGDEGKGKIISYLSFKDKPDIVVRAGVGTNAGHTVVVKDKTYKIRQIPTGFVSEDSRLLIGPGALVDPDIFHKEVSETDVENRIGLDEQCAIITKEHISLDQSSPHTAKKIGSTGTGCGPCNAERAIRKVKIAKEIPSLKEYFTDVPLEVNTALDQGGKVLIEGTQGTFLSLYHGTYPFVTSKDITAAAVCSDIGLGPTRGNAVIVVFKAFVTRVGSGYLENELSEEEAKKRGWFEVATVTGRKRRSAPFNIKLAKRATMLNGATQAAITKLDIVFPECKGVKSFNKLSSTASDFIKNIEKEIGIPVTLIGVGPEVEEIIDRRREFS